ncbi:type III secretion system stator protein SctL [Paraburkholderia strydomiana]|uniref:type III secretion system stator protein SctL n=1 Tax=Paraburkholderia strydomiana TaxID=1245417 RepID=UPI0038B957B0
MIIWLREPNSERKPDGASIGVGVDRDVVPREALASLVELDEGYLALQQQHADVLAQAAAQGDAMRDAARADADALRAEARREFDTAHERGYDAGRREALSQWYTRTAQLLAQRYELQMSLRQRVADLVVRAVEKIVVNEEPAALFARASDVVERIIEGSRCLQVRVHPDERDAAVEGFSHAVAQWRERGQPVQLTVLADRTLEPGACVCESDIGSVDASLKVQVDAVRTAVEAALRRVVGEAAELAGAANAAEIAATGEEVSAVPAMPATSATSATPAAEVEASNEAYTGKPQEEWA